MGAEQIVQGAGKRLFLQKIVLRRESGCIPASQARRRTGASGTARSRHCSRVHQRRSTSSGRAGSRFTSTTRLEADAPRYGTRGVVEKLVICCKSRCKAGVRDKRALALPAHEQPLLHKIEHGLAHRDPGLRHRYRTAPARWGYGRPRGMRPPITSFFSRRISCWYSGFWLLFFQRARPA